MLLYLILSSLVCSLMLHPLYSVQCPLGMLDTIFVLSVTAKTSFASSRSALFQLTISELCIAVGVPSASLCPIFYHPVPVLLCAASSPLKAAAIASDLYFCTLHCCVWDKNISFCIGQGEPRRRELLCTEYEAPQAFLSPVQVLSSVSTSAPLSGRILLHNFTRHQRDRRRAH